MKFRIYRGKDKDWRWRLCAKNGKIIADSSEGYKRRSQVKKMIQKIILGPHKIIE